MTQLRIRGVSYTSGIHSADDVRRVMRVIRSELSCTSVMLIDRDVESLGIAARIALDEDLDVVVRPHLPDVRAGAVLEHLGRMASAAEQLRVGYPGGSPSWSAPSSR